MSEHTVIISPAGTLQFVWHDELADLVDEGTATITRAGDVEPSADGRGWMADCSRVGGGVHGPFRLREQALEKERGVVVAAMSESVSEGR